MKAAFFDIDGTIVKPFTAGMYLSFLAEYGIFQKECLEKFNLATEKYQFGLITYEDLASVWETQLGEGLKDTSEKDMYAVTQKFWITVEPRVAPWAKDIIHLFNTTGYKTIAISGSPIELLNLYKEKLGLEQVFGSTSETNNGIYTGDILLNLVLRNEKEMIFNHVIKTEDINLSDSFGFGDNEHDRSFLDRVGHPIVIISESNLKEYAKEKGWPVFNFKDNVNKEIKKLFFSSF